MFRRSVKKTVFEKRGPDSCDMGAGRRDGTWGETGVVMGAGGGAGAGAETGAGAGAGAEVEMGAVVGTITGAVTGASTGAGEGAGRKDGIDAGGSGAASSPLGIIEEIEYRAREKLANYKGNLKEVNLHEGSELKVILSTPWAT